MTRSVVGNAGLCLLLIVLMVAAWMAQADRSIVLNVSAWPQVFAILAVFTLGSVAAARRAQHAPASLTVAGSETLVVFASQGGFAQELAQRTHDRLAAGGQSVSLVGMDHLAITDLNTARRSLWVVSTTGEGDAPDMALPFLRLAVDNRLPGHEFAVLALGDRSYEQFCAFGLQMASWLENSGAKALTATVTVDNADPIALQRWDHLLDDLGALETVGATQAGAPFFKAVLKSRQLLNPGSLGWAAYRIVLTVPTHQHWQAGDIAQIAAMHTMAETPSPRLASSEWREYSIANDWVPGELELLVRLTQQPDGSHGKISGHLCTALKVGDPVAVRIRENAGFHVPESNCPLILIGNGTGIAGLRSLLQARERAGALDNWLLFGERQRSVDLFFGEELLAPNAPLAHLDLAFSRDPQARYVWQLLMERRDRLQDWLSRGASLYVCGSRDTMGRDVDRVLRELCGDATIDELIRSRRYRRDVY